MNIRLNRNKNKEYQWSFDTKESDEELVLLLEKSFQEVKDLSENSKYKFIIAYFDVDWWERHIMIVMYFDKHFDHIVPSLEFSMEFDNLEEWNKPWSIASYVNQFEKNVEKLNNSKFAYYQEDPDYVLPGFGVSYFPHDSNLKIKTELENVFNVVEQLLIDTNNDLRFTINSETLFTYFQFPESIGTACKQYLLYFTQFIADLGVNVETEIKEESNYTLFKVSPKNKEESLEKIRDALTIYLNAPKEPNFELTISRETDIALKQWESNYYHLKSQLSLASSIIQAKDSTIEMLQLSNYQYKQILESKSLKKESDMEKIINGLVEIKKYESNGLNINLPEIYRRLKRLINR